jgi:hypothetical protein
MHLEFSVCSFESSMTDLQPAQVFRVPVFGIDDRVSVLVKNREFSTNRSFGPTLGPALPLIREVLADFPPE